MKHQEIKFHPFKIEQKNNVAIDINRQSGFTHQIGNSTAPFVGALQMEPIIEACV